MKARLSVLTFSIALGVALAQTTPPTLPAHEGTTPQQTKEKQDMKAGAPAEAKTASNEMKTTTYKGVLVDMSCASSGSASAASTPAAGEATKASTSDQANSANRAAGDSGGNCPVTANSRLLGMKLDDGKVVRFDLVGNQRAQDEVKNNKKWSKDLSDNKPVHAKVSGVLDGDKLIVSSIH